MREKPIQIIGTRKWPYQFKTRCGGLIKYSGSEAYDLAHDFSREAGIILRKNWIKNPKKKGPK